MTTDTIRRIMVALGLAGTAALAGCDSWALSFDGSSGLVVVIVSGDDPAPSGGYRIRTRQAGQPDRIVTVEPGRELRLDAPTADPIELTLLPPEGCRALGANPRTVTPAPDAVVRASFELECGAA